MIIITVFVRYVIDQFGIVKSTVENYSDCIAEEKNHVFNEHLKFKWKVLILLIFSLRRFFILSGKMFASRQGIGLGLRMTI